MGKVKGPLDLPGQLIKRMTTMGLPITTRYIALVVLQFGRVTDQELAWYCGMTELSIQPHIQSLQSVGILGEDFEISIPEYGQSAIARIALKGKHKESKSLTRLVDKFLEKYTRLWQEKYKDSFYATPSLIKKVRAFISKVGDESALNRLEAYMSDSDPWLAKNAHPLGVFFSRSNQYCGGQNGKAEGITEHGESFDREVEAFEERKRRERGK